MKLVEIQENKDLCRDVESQALVNTNRAAFEKFKNSKALALSKKSEMEEVKKRLGNLENTLEEIVRLIKAK